MQTVPPGIRIFCALPKRIYSHKTRNIIHCLCSEISGSFYISIFLSFVHVHPEKHLYPQQLLLQEKDYWTVRKPFFRKVYTVFDMELGRIVFAQAK